MGHCPTAESVIVTPDMLLQASDFEVMFMKMIRTVPPASRLRLVSQSLDNGGNVLHYLAKADCVETLSLPHGVPFELLRCDDDGMTILRVGTTEFGLETFSLLNTSMREKVLEILEICVTQN